MLDPMAGSHRHPARAAWGGGGGGSGGGCREAMLTLRKQTRGGGMTELETALGRVLLPSVGLVPFNFKLTDLLVHNG